MHECVLLSRTQRVTETPAARNGQLGIMPIRPVSAIQPFIGLRMSSAALADLLRSTRDMA